MKKILVLVLGVLLFGINVYAADGDLVVNGNLCLGTDCTNTLHVSGGLYGHCKGVVYSSYPQANKCEAKVPASCSNLTCACPTGYDIVIASSTSNNSIIGTITTTYYMCYKN